MTIKHHHAAAIEVGDDKITITRVKTSWEAVVLIFSGYIFFLLNGWKSAVITLLITLAAMVGVFVLGYQYYTAKANSVEFKEASPIKPHKVGMNFSLVPEARAAVIAKGDSIIWDGEFWGMKDTDFEIYKVSEQPVILIHDKVTGHTDQMTVPTLQDRIQKNRSKK